MADQLISSRLTEDWDIEGGSLCSATEADVLGVTHFLSKTYVVGGYTYTNLTDAIAQGAGCISRPRRSESPSIAGPGLLRSVAASCGSRPVDLADDLATDKTKHLFP
jgi:hypothetical protein